MAHQVEEHAVRGFSFPLLRRIRRPKLSSECFTLYVSFLLVLFYNQSFWRHLLEIRSASSLRNLPFLLAFLMLIAAVNNLVLSLGGFKYVQKPVAILALLTAALATYFTNTYGGVIDSTMIQNAIETDAGEVAELISGKLLLYLLVLGVLPALAVCGTRITYRRGFADLRMRVASVLVSVAVIGTVGAVYYSDFAALGTNHHELRHRITPENVVVGTAKYLSRASRPELSRLETVGEDALLAGWPAGSERKTLAILVVGETARAQEFSLNGYGRQTNPSLKREDVVSFANVDACGTSTAVSLPCMFSSRRRSDYRTGDARRREGLLDVLAHAGVSVLWRDNNSGCKGVCDRVESQDLSRLEIPDVCDSEECFDEVLLDGLDGYLSSQDGDVFVVLHQDGSHGPAYYLRYPKRFEMFTPVCSSNQLQECTKEEVVNTYDNTILYTDYFLGRVIEFLRQQGDRYRTVMLYLSDHGESLGESHLYLHGLPYSVAPAEQKRVPFIVWLSEDYQQASAIDPGCLSANRDRPMSHDNLFHSVLGLLNVETRVYDPSLDVFARCRVSGTLIADRDRSESELESFLGDSESRPPSVVAGVGRVRSDG